MIFGWKENSDVWKKNSDVWFNSWNLDFIGAKCPVSVYLNNAFPYVLFWNLSFLSLTSWCLLQTALYQHWLGLLTITVATWTIWSCLACHRLQRMCRHQNSPCLRTSWSQGGGRGQFYLILMEYTLRFEVSFGFYNLNEEVTQNQINIFFSPICDIF